MLLGYVYKLKPNSQQSARMDSWLNLLRSNYNWSLADRINTYEQRLIQGDYCDVRTKSVACPLTCCVTKGGATGEPWRDNGGRRSAGEIQITALPQLKEARPWYKDVDSTVVQQNIKRLDRAYENFLWEGRGYPKFKNRSTFGSFTFTTGVKVKGNKIYLPKLGWMRFYNSRSIPEGFKIKSVTVRKKVSGWFVSIRIEASIPSFPVRSNEEIKTVVGLDLGLTKLVHCSDGSTVSNPRFATNKKTRRLLSIRQRRVSRSKRGKNNRAKAQRKLASLQHKIATQREAHQWQTAKKIVNKAEAIALEDLNVRGMMKRCKPKWDEKTGRFLKNGQSQKRSLNRSIADASWSELISKIEYMAEKSGKVVFRVNPRHSSQECSVCHHVDQGNRDGEKFLCTNCSHVDDADWQAARTIRYRAIEQHQLVIRIIKKVRQDLPEPKQLSLFETPTSELTEVKRRHPSALKKSKRREPGNLIEQLDLFNQDSNDGAISASL